MSEVGEAALVDDNNGSTEGTEINDSEAKPKDALTAHPVVVDKNGDLIMGEEDDTEEKKGETQIDEVSSGLEEGEFEVERILDVKVKDGMLKFEVRWKGYGSEEDSWEPEGNLETARLVLDEYIANNEEKVEKAKRVLEERKKKGQRVKGRKRFSSTYREKNRAIRNSSRRSVLRAGASESEEDEEMSERSEESRKKRQRKKKCKDRDQEASVRAENSDDDDFVVPAYSTRRGKKAADEREGTTSSEKATHTHQEPILKEPRPRNAKNAWLYDDADDADSDDDSDRNDSANNKKKEEEGSEVDVSSKTVKRGKRSSVGEEVAQVSSKRARKESPLERTPKREDKETVKESDGKKRKDEEAAVRVKEVINEEQVQGQVTDTAKEVIAQDALTLVNYLLARSVFAEQLVDQ